MLITLKKVWRILRHHIGLGGEEAHPTVDDWQNGFMSSSMFLKFNEIFKRRKRVSWDEAGKRVDIMTLEAGYYDGSGFLNHPQQPTIATSWVSNVDVSYGADGRKQFKVWDNLAGKSWTKTIHTDGAKGSDWSIDGKYRRLWGGDISKVGDTAVITDVLTNYAYLEFGYYYLNNNGTSKIRLGRLENIEEIAFCMSNLADDKALSRNTGEVALSINKDNKTLTIVRNKSVYTDEKGVSSLDAVAVVHLDYIDGWF